MICAKSKKPVQHHSLMDDSEQAFSLLPNFVSNQRAIEAAVVLTNL